MKKVYLAMTGDIIHHGHINIITEARKYGEVIVGLLTDEAIASYKKNSPIELRTKKKR